MLAKLTPTPEQTAAFAARQPVVFVDAQGVATHVALPLAEARRLLDEHLSRELAESFRQADAGEVEPWDIEATIAEAHRRFASRPSQ